MHGKQIEDDNINIDIKSNTEIKDNEFEDIIANHVKNNINSEDKIDKLSEDSKNVVIDENNKSENKEEQKESLIKDDLNTGNNLEETKEIISNKPHIDLKDIDIIESKMNPGTITLILLETPLQNQHIEDHKLTDSPIALNDYVKLKLESNIIKEENLISNEESKNDPKGMHILLHKENLKLMKGGSFKTKIQNSFVIKSQSNSNKLKKSNISSNIGNINVAPFIKPAKSKELKLENVEEITVENSALKQFEEQYLKLK